MTASSDYRDISTSSIVVATKDQVSSDLAGETVLLSMQSAMYYGLDQVGSRIWELVREPIRVSDLRDAITREYDVEPERCEGRFAANPLRAVGWRSEVGALDATVQHRPPIVRATLSPVTRSVPDHRKNRLGHLGREALHPKGQLSPTGPRRGITAYAWRSSGRVPHRRRENGRRPT